MKVRLKVPGLYVLWISTAVNKCYPAYTLLPAETYHLSRITVNARHGPSSIVLEDQYRQPFGFGQFLIVSALLQMCFETLRPSLNTINH